jgi:WD40 repeat protein/serine/threonine protein kinase
MSDRDLSGWTLGDYVLRELIRKGGYGAVYRSEQRLLEREVVVKVLHAERSDNASRERFLREARLAAQLDHPYAAHVYDFGTADQGNVLWIAMERVRGVPLDTWLDKHGPMPPEQFGPFFEGLCEVVHAAHDLGIVHRDLKPSNIMVVESKGRRFPKLLDFGIAKWNRPSETAPASRSDEDRNPDRDDVKTKRLPVRPRRAGRNVPCYGSDSRRQLTPPGGCLGSPPYMPQEQWIRADTVGPEVDIYALGIIAYETLTARRPFVANQTGDYFAQHKHAPVPQLGHGFTPALDLVIQCALDKNPRARYGSASELAADLQRALRTSAREQLRASAQQWHDQCGPPGLLWGADVLENTLRSVPRETLGPLECSFVAESERRIRRARWVRRSVVALAAAVAIGGFLYRATMQTELAQKQTELAQEQTRLAREVTGATVTQAELEQGRSSLLQGVPDAQLHLSRAYQRGDRSPSTAFMLARAMQPRLAEQARLTSTFGRMWSAAFSPDGRQIVTTDDQAAQIWDARTYRRIFTLFHGDTVYQAMYSADGARLVTAGGDGTVKIWDAANGALVRELRHDGPKLRYFAAALSPDGRLVAAIDTRGDVAHVWDAVSGAPVAEIRNDGLEFPGLAFSPDGCWLATTGGSDVHVLDARTWRLTLTIRGSRVHGLGLAFDPTGARLITGAMTGDVAIWSIPSGTRIRHLRDIGEPVDAVAFSPDGQLVVAASRDGAVRVWHARSGELQSQLNSRYSAIFAVEFDRTSRRVLAAGAAGAVVVGDADQGVPDAVLEGPPNVLVAHFDPSSRRVVGASLDGTAWVWDATSPYHRELPDGRLLRTIGHDAAVNAVAFATTGREIVSGAVDGSLLVTGDDGARFVLPASPGGIDAVAFLPDGRLISSDAQRRLRVYDPSGAVLANLELPTRVMSLRVDGTRLVTTPIYSAGPASPVLVDLERYQVVTQLDGHVGRVFSARWVAGGQILTAGGDGTARLWDGTVGLLRQTYRGGSQVLYDATLASDGLVMAGGADGRLRFWDETSGRQLWALQAHTSPIIGVHVESGDLVTRGFTGELARWTLPSPGQVIQACDGRERCAIVDE